MCNLSVATPLEKNDSLPSEAMDSLAPPLAAGALLAHPCSVLGCQWLDLVQVFGECGSRITSRRWHFKMQKMISLNVRILQVIFLCTILFSFGKVIQYVEKSETSVLYSDNATSRYSITLISLESNGNSSS